MQASEIKNNKEKEIKEFTNNDKKLQFKFVIYVLKLAEDRIYVGRTTKNDLDKRIRLHKSRKGSAWTRKYKFVEEMKDYYIEDASPFDEDRRVKQLMYLFGPNMVRGGSYSRTEDLSPE